MKKILLIDDEKTLNESLSDVMEALGHQVSSYLSIKNALQQEDFSKLDIVICDLGLPDEDALDFVRWVKKHYACLPFVILSAFSEEEKIKKGVEAGADLYLVKPASLDQLRQIIFSA